MAGQSAGDSRARAEALHRDAIHSFRSGNLNHAILRLRQAVEIDPANPEAWNDLGVLERKHDETSRAAASFGRAVALKPDFVNAIYNLALAQEALHQLPLALGQSERLIQLSPRFARGHFLRGRLLWEQQQADGAEKELREALALEPALAEARTLLGTVLRSRGHVSESIEQLRQSLGENPQSPDALFELGLALFASGDANAARDAFEQALRIQPDFAEARVNLAQIFESEGKLSQALDQYRLGLASAPHNEQAQIRLVRALAGQDPGKARELAASALLDHQRSAALHFEMGKLQAKAGDFAGARRHLQTAIEIQPGISDYHLELSRVLHDLNLPREQRSELEIAVRLDPKSAGAHYALATLLKNEGRIDASKAEYARVRDLRQSEVTRDLALGYMRTGVRLGKAGDYSSAVIHLRKAVEANPQLTEAWFDLAGALMQKGDVDEAIQTFPQALRLEPGWPEAHYQFALALLRANRRPEAIAELRIALRQDPKHPEALRTLTNLGESR
ncbi:MAG TPA: tetratricopeptide repeat protein [Bryobacteraceae bacterium]|nr:tetratricopeptide repeat protein [Bryobacteraceae bacterium]